MLTRDPPRGARRAFAPRRAAGRLAVAPGNRPGLRGALCSPPARAAGPGARGAAAGPGCRAARARGRRGRRGARGAAGAAAGASRTRRPGHGPQRDAVAGAWTGPRLGFGSWVAVRGAARAGAGAGAGDRDGAGHASAESPRVTSTPAPVTRSSPAPPSGSRRPALAVSPRRVTKTAGHTQPHPGFVCRLPGCPPDAHSGLEVGVGPGSSQMVCARVVSSPAGAIRWGEQVLHPAEEPRAGLAPPGPLMGDPRGLPRCSKAVPSSKPVICTQPQQVSSFLCLSSKAGILWYDEEDPPSPLVSSLLVTSKT